MKVELEVPLSPEDCAELSGMSYWTILRRIREGHLPAYQPAGGREYRVNPEDFRDWLYGRRASERSQGAPAAPRRSSPSSSRAGSVARLKAIEERAAS